MPSASATLNTNVFCCAPVYEGQIISYLAHALRERIRKRESVVALSTLSFITYFLAVSARTPGSENSLPFTRQQERLRPRKRIQMPDLLHLQAHVVSNASRFDLSQLLPPAMYQNALALQFSSNTHSKIHAHPNCVQCQHCNEITGQLALKRYIIIILARTHTHFVHNA